MADPVVPSGLNTLTVPARHLPLGTPTDCPAGSSRWTVWIPSQAGGRLSVTLEGATSIAIQDASGAVLNSGTADVGLSLDSAMWGERVVVVDASAAGQLVATFTQIFWSRQTPSPSSPPLIPYNFWYWPCARGSKWANDTTKVLQRYGKAIGNTSPDPGIFEHDFHQLDNAPGWQGHCHNAAPASALFEEPGPQTISSGWYDPFTEPFTSDEMKLLGAEFFGNFGNVELVWQLPPGTSVHNPPRFGLLAYFKPSGPKTLPELVERLKETFDPTRAQQFATEVLAEAGGPDAFAAQVDRDLGKSGAEFFGVLLRRIATEGEPLLMNLRGYGSAVGPEEIWNQVCFHFYATYVETAGGNDKLDVGVYCNLTSNIDKPPPNTDRPATVTSSGSVEPGTSLVSCLQYFHQLRVIFRADGMVDDRDPRSRWIAIMGSDGDQLFAPTHAQRLRPPGKQPVVGTTANENLMFGNPVVGRELLDSMKLNRRFR